MSLAAHRASLGANTPLRCTGTARTSTRLRSAKHLHSRCIVRCAGESVRQTFEDLRAKNECALVPFLCAGDPDLKTTAAALVALDESGADVIELGVPYSDPLADGPVIQGAHSRALVKGTKLQDVIDMLAEVSPKIGASVVLFTYYNPIMARGIETFLADIKQAGAAGLVVPDLPLEETEGLREKTKAAGIELVLLATPTTPQERMGMISKAADGFVYLVSDTGVTGMRSKVADRVQGLLGMLREETDKPIAVGFGISGPEQAKQVSGWGADGVIVGSALVRMLAEAENPEDGVKAVGDLAASIKKAANEDR